ncbi:MAG: oligoendopeptidase [candidate division Zixibacteria bacterium HGW-Zixibacteria-1]|nr:MAG: oligoendopeptidase [candidate division Zixibacteria bacterium HGW-Zixibacteria-1]
MSSTVSTSKAPTWDMDSIFPGGSSSTKYAEFRKKIKIDLKSAFKNLKSLPQKYNRSSRPAWIDYINKLQKLSDRLSQAHAFVECLVNADVNDAKARQIFGEIDVFNAEMEKIGVMLEAFAKKQPDKEWQKLVTGDELKDCRFYLDEMRRIAKMKMEPEFEAMAAELSVNGYHAWNRLYNKIYGDVRVEFTEKNKTETLSVGQLANKMTSPDRSIRRQSFEKLEAAWENRSAEASMALNFQAGFRLSLYERRKWDSPLIEPLLMCRVKKETIDAMWSAVGQAAPKIRKYIKAKKKLLGLDAYRWYDQWAPVGASEKIYTFKEAADLIVGNITAFNKDQADFTRMAVEKRWVEAEDRPGKGGGAFCSPFRQAKQSRVMMTYSGNFDSLATLAHELGHAYHQWLRKDMPSFAAGSPMPLSETASIFNEFLIIDSELNKTDDINTKLMFLDMKLQNAATLFCNLHARFIFDNAFYAERRNGLVSKERLDEMMVEAQKAAFMGTLADDGYHPLFWASKLHFFLTDVPYYNFPYTFGFLFAGGVYNRAKTEGPAFAEKYIKLLSGTGLGSSEQTAKKHMGVDLTKEDFWLESVNRIMSDTEPFVRLVEKIKR